MLSEPSGRIFTHRSFIVIFIFGAFAVCYKIFHLKNPELSLTGNIFFIRIPLLVGYITGIATLIRFQKNKELNEIIISLLPVLLTLMIILLEFFK